MPDNVDRTFIDRRTRIDDILVDELLPVLNKIQAGDITAPDNGDGDVLADIRDLLGVPETKLRTIPDDENQYFTFGEGNNYINFEQGYIKEGDGTVTKLRSTLTREEYIESLMIYSTRDSTLDLGTGAGQVPIQAYTWYSFDGIKIKNLYYKHTTSTIIESEVVILAATTPGGIKAIPDQKFDELSTVSIGTSGIYAAEIVQNAISYEDIIIIGNSYEISHIIFSSEANLNFRLWFFDKDDHPGTFIGYVDLDIPTYGARIAGAGLYYLDVAGLSLTGVDSDYSGELHLGLQNLSATQKETTDSVTIEIHYKLMDDSSQV